MNLRILLPFRIFAEHSGVARIVAETRQGSYGLLPHRLDCVAALMPGILTYEIDAQGEQYAAVDQGVLVKSGAEVLISVRQAIAGTDLDRLRAAVEQQFLHIDQQERSVRAVVARLEAGFLRRFANFQHAR